MAGNERIGSPYGVVCGVVRISCWLELTIESCRHFRNLGDVF